MGIYKGKRENIGDMIRDRVRILCISIISMTIPLLNILIQQLFIKILRSVLDIIFIQQIVH